MKKVIILRTRASRKRRRIRKTSKKGMRNGRGSGAEDQTKETEQPSGSSKSQVLAEVPLLDRIPSDVLAVAFIDYGKILEKGGKTSCL